MPYYSRIILNSFYNRLFPKLFRHNRRMPISESVNSSFTQATASRIRTLVLIDSNELRNVFEFSCSSLFFVASFSVHPLHSGSFSRLFSLNKLPCLHSLSRSRDTNRRNRLVSIFHAAASLKALSPFDFVNTSGQKPATLRAHFTHHIEG